MIITCKGLYACALGCHSNTSVVHMRDQRFSFEIDSNRNFLSPGKALLNSNFARFCPHIYPYLPLFFCGHVWWSLKNDPKCLNRIQKDPFSHKQAYFDPQSRFARIAFSLKKQPFFRVSGVAHVYNTNIQVIPWGMYASVHNMQSVQI